MTIDQRLALVRSLRRRLSEVGPEVEREEGDFERISVPGAAGDVLRDLLVSEQAEVVIEIGLGYAGSALAIAEALLINDSARPRHLIIDPYQDHFQRSGWRALTQAGWAGACQLLEERSQSALPRLAADGLVADAAFVDGSHLFHHVFVDLFYINELLRPSGLVILDDCELPSVAAAVGYFETHHGWEALPTASESRLAAWRTSDS